MCAIPLWPLFHVLARRHNDGRIGCISYFVLWLACFCFWQLGSPPQDLRPIETTRLLLSHYLETLRDSVQTMSPQVIDRDWIESLPVGEGEDEIILNYFKATTISRVERHNIRLSKLIETGWPEILSPQLLKNDQGLVESREILNRYRLYLRFAEKDRAQEEEEYRRSFDQLPLNEDARSDFEHGNHAATRLLNGLPDPSVKESDRLLTLTEQIIDFLAMAEGRWKIEDGEIHVHEDDLDSYAALYLKYDELVRSQHKLIDNLKNEIDTRIEPIMSDD